jgi:septum formation inhibitor MinC
VAIDGCYMAAEEFPQRLIGMPVHIRRQGESIVTHVYD